MINLTRGYKKSTYLYCIYLVSGRQTRSVCTNNTQPTLQISEGKENGRRQAFTHRWFCHLRRRLQLQNGANTSGHHEHGFSRLSAYTWLWQGYVFERRAFFYCHPILLAQIKRTCPIPNVSVNKVSHFGCICRITLLLIMKLRYLQQSDFSRQVIVSRYRMEYENSIFSIGRYFSYFSRS